MGRPKDPEAAKRRIEMHRLRTVEKKSLTEIAEQFRVSNEYVRVSVIEVQRAIDEAKAAAQS